MEATVFADQGEKGDAVPGVKVEDEEVPKVMLDPDVSEGQAGEQEAVDAAPDVKTSADNTEDSQTRESSFSQRSRNPAHPIRSDPIRRTKLRIAGPKGNSRQGQ